MMKIAFRCEKCRNIFMQAEEDLCLLIDNFEKKMSFFCPSCKHDNIIDFADWKKQQAHSPLPRIGTM